MAYSDDEEMSDEGNQRPMVVSMIPDTLNSHQLRCCLRCHIILSVSQFVRHGCPNCQDIDMEGDKTLVEDYTTKNFSGGVSVMNPARSWVARQLKLSRAPSDAVRLVLAFLKVPSALACTQSRLKETERLKEITTMSMKKTTEGAVYFIRSSVAFYGVTISKSARTGEVARAVSRDLGTLDHRI
ncbi:Transcription elongation factor SPT4 [Perkinsus olseni]|uniref:Transcription elongation factor SPT4 n=1 Tax=Perkinsus olseni TaxID=32597 RepID=A0A7J6MD58_PEROL|nr:Transcription elongation factor SPT4 [Perkinsus olseni]KAF4669495.1 Transcription elongation factor SPT4 [Perkinsus olseni]